MRRSSTTGNLLLLEIKVRVGITEELRLLSETSETEFNDSLLNPAFRMNYSGPKSTSMRDGPRPSKPRPPRFIQTNTRLMSAGETPEMRDA